MTTTQKVEQLYSIARLANVNAETHEKTLELAKSIIADLEPKDETKPDTKKKSA